MGHKNWEDVKRRKFSPEKLEELDRRVDAKIVEMDLRTLRQFVGKTQVDLATLTDMTQAEVSRLEHRDDWRVSTLQRIVHALGGKLEVYATFKNKSIRLRAA